MANTKITNPELFNLGDSTSATQLPVMTTAQRIAMNAPPSLTVDYLVVAGGGGGGGGTGFATNGNVGAGGGGAGGLLTSTAVALTSEATYTVNIGNGGGGGPWAGSGTSIAGTSGSNSLITGTGINALAYGGGGGGSGRGNYQNAGLLGLPGGSGGGSGFMSSIGQGGAGTAGQGNNGGYGGSGGQDGSGGGGGAGAVGSNGTYQGTAPYYYPGGAGGAGVQNSITGVSPTPYYAGGGGGGSLYNSPTYQGAGGNGGSAIGGSGGRSSTNSSYSGTAGAANTGSGGGGGCRANTTNSGGDGGSGVVILRYATSDVASYTATGLTPTETTDGTDTILSFTTVGTGTITFTSSTPTSTISTGEMIFNSDTDKVEYFDGTKWYGITYEADPADIFQDGSNLFTSNFSNSTLSSLESGITYRSYGRSGGNYFIDNTIPVFRNDLPSGRSGFGKSLTLTDTGDDPTITIDGVTPLSSVLTFSFWVYVVAHDNDDNVVLGVNLKRQNNSYMWVYIYEPNRSSYTYDSFSTLPTGSWQHMVVTKRSDNYVYTYKNNSLLGSINAGTKIPLPAGPFLGSANEFRLMSFSDADVSNEVWITGVRIFNRGLTASEITTLYNENPTY
jgi:hypothetical protein